jgi:hypothetical protein
MKSTRVLSKDQKTKGNAEQEDRVTVLLLCVVGPRVGLIGVGSRFIQSAVWAVPRNWLRPVGFENSVMRSQELMQLLGIR